MTHQEQITAFADSLDKMVNRYRSEFDLPLASAVGVLHFKAHLLMTEAQENHGDTPPEDQDDFDDLS